MSVGNNQPSPDEIPEALRETSPLAVKKRHRSWRLLGGGAGIILAGGITGFFFWERDPDVSISSSPPIEKTVSESAEKITSKDEEKTAQESAAREASKDLLGHLPYEEATPDTLTALTADGRIKLKKPAAQKFLEMQRDARREGILLVPLSGFRSQEQQEYLFFGVKAQRGQVTTERAEVSAPPGYSEHHTGYAIDIGDGKAPETHVETTFGDTEAFAWLEENAARYSFELSFPKNNSQQISYEPWHWRYVGNQESLEIFYKQQ